MAITKIKAIKSTVNKAISYITNYQKTDGSILISGYNCEPDYAYLNFKMTQALSKEVKGNYKEVGQKSNLGYHLIQSFSPTDNIDPEKAHEIGKKLADELLDRKHEYVIATHIDKGHIHNHIIFNSVSFYDYKKFRTQPYKTAARIRAISDRICSENELSIIKEPSGLGTSYAEYMARKNNTSWKSEIRKRINFILEEVTNYDEFKQSASALGVVVDDSGKHIKYKYIKQERFVRGDKLADTDKYLKETIIQQIEENKYSQDIVKKSIGEAIKESSNYNEFTKIMKGKYNIIVKKDRSGEAVYKLNDINGNQVKERALGKNYTISNIENSIINKKELEQEINSDINILDKFNKRIKSNNQGNDTILILNDNDISKITVDGILVNVIDNEELGKVFIDNKHVNFNKLTNKYEVFIGEKYYYYFVKDKLEPDILESVQVSQKFIKGEQLIRSIEINNNVKPTSIELKNDNIKGIGKDGILITLPSLGIDRLFIENKYVVFDKLEKTCTINVYENWNYNCIGSDSKIKKNSIKGKDIIEELNNAQDRFSNIGRRITVAERKNNISTAKELANILLTMNKENLTSSSDFDLKISDLKEKRDNIKQTIKELENKNSQYKEVAKYLITYNKYADIKINLGKQSIFKRKEYENKYAGELRELEFVEKKLAHMGVNTNVDPDKVVELIKSQDKEVSELNLKLKEIESKIEDLNNKKNIIDNLVEKQINKDKQKEQEER